MNIIDKSKIAGIIITIAFFPIIFFIMSKNNIESSLTGKYEIIYLNGDIEIINSNKELTLLREGCVVNSNIIVRCGVRGFRPL